MAIDIDLLGEEVRLANELAELESRANTVRTELRYRLANFIRSEADFQDLRANPMKAINKLRIALIDDNGIPYEGVENLESNLKDIGFSQSLEKKIVDDNWYSSEEKASEQQAFDLAVFG